jgi:putative SOS response-associated peptidase YedK
MCGRFALYVSWAQLCELMRASAAPDVAAQARYNIAPTQRAPIVRRDARGEREIVELRWGLIPSWARDASIGAHTINARSESVATKPAFRSAFRARRCLVPVSGFYEWQKTGARKQPWFIRPKHAPIFALAGLWERWTPPGEPPLETFTIVTTAANERLAALHDRMPAILAAEEHERWLDPAEKDLAHLQALLAPAPAEAIEAYRVGTLVNRASADAPACVEPLREES